MNSLLTTASAVQACLDTAELPNALIGGLAVQVWGQPRVTQDVDLTVLTGVVRDVEAIDTLLERFTSRIENPHGFAAQARVVLLKDPVTGSDVDVSLGADPFEERMLDRAVLIEHAPDARLRTATAEDLLVLKLFAGRPIDWMDVEGVLIRQANQLDLDQVEAEFRPFLEVLPDPADRWDRWARLRRTHG